MKVYIPYPLSNNCLKLFTVRYNMTLVDDLEECDLVVVCGGGDIHPSHYNSKEHPCTAAYSKDGRDKKEIELVREAIVLDKKVFGICRGLQLIHVVLGGKLYQHLDGHPNYHGCIGEDDIVTNSVHHQNPMVDLPNMEVLLKSEGACFASYYDIFFKDFRKELIYPVEAAVYRGFKCGGVQFHPEAFNPSEDSIEFSLNLIKNL